MYAIIEDKGHQIKVQEGDVVRIATRELSVDAATITFDNVLMVGDMEGEQTQPKVGQPLVDGAKVMADVIGPDSEKTTIIKFKRRKTYRRKRGHRQAFLKVKVTSIEA